MQGTKQSISIEQHLVYELQHVTTDIKIPCISSTELGNFLDDKI